MNRQPGREGDVLTVSQLNAIVKALLDNEPLLSHVMVRGELSNFKYHTQSGHLYMTLKDEKSAVRAVMFASSAKKLLFRPENGMKVIVEGRVAVFERDGQYQLYLTGMQPDGLGALHLAYEQLKAKLAAEGKPTHAVLCHRLDTGTSGLVLLAKNNAAEAFLTEAIKKREIEKRYLCVTFGRPNPPAALLRDYLLKDAERGIVRITDTTAGGAKEVITGYETLAVSGRLALLEVELVTGRTHQIRAHLAHIGCPILGDSKYGNNAANRELRLKYQALCAWELKFPAKISDERFAHLTGRVFHAEKPWYCQQVEDGTLK